MTQKSYFSFFKAIIFVFLVVCSYSDTLNSTNSKFVEEKKLLNDKKPLQIVDGNYKPVNYWQEIEGGEQLPVYKVINSVDSLNSYWRIFERKKITINKPDVDFTNNTLVVIQPGECNIKFKFSVKIDKNNNLVKFIVSNYPIELPVNKIRFSKSPIFMFEIPSPPKSNKIDCVFKIDRRSTWSQPK